MKQQKQYFLILGDVINSRSIADRKAFEKKIKLAIQQVAKTYDSSLKLPIQRWKGLDEIALIVNDVENIFSVLQCINKIIFPNQMRFVVTKGSLILPKNVVEISKLDGDIFTKASELMAELKKEKLIVKLDAVDAERDFALENQINGFYILKENWTEKQHNIYTLFAQTNSQELVAKKIKTTQQLVSKTLKAINANKVKTIETNIVNWNKNYYKL
jgi:SatD family (SatD)